VNVLAVVFDFNGTLSDDEPVLDELFRGIGYDLGLELTSEDYYLSLAGLSDPAIIARLVEWSGSDIDPGRLLEAKIAKYKEIVTAKPTITPETVAFVEAVAARVPIAIASGALREEVEHGLDLAGIRERFRAVICADDVEHGKPHPEGYLKAAEALGVEPAFTLVFEDADAGVQAARAAGMRCAALTNPAYTGHPVAADVVLDRLDPDLVDRLVV
jgi:beta-phosphoglucomutase